MPSLSISKHTATKYDKVLDLGSGGGFPGLALAILQNKKMGFSRKKPKKMRISTPCHSPAQA